MSFFWIFTLLFIGAIGGYSIGHDCGRQEGYAEGAAEMYKANR